MAARMSVNLPSARRCAGRCQRRPSRCVCRTTQLSAVIDPRSRHNRGHCHGTPITPQLRAASALCVAHLRHDARVPAQFRTAGLPALARSSNRRTQGMAQSLMRFEIGRKCRECSFQPCASSAEPGGLRSRHDTDPAGEAYPAGSASSLTA